MIVANLGASHRTNTDEQGTARARDVQASHWLRPRSRWSCSTIARRKAKETRYARHRTDHGTEGPHLNCGHPHPDSSGDVIFKPYIAGGGAIGVTAYCSEQR